MHSLRWSLSAFAAAVVFTACSRGDTSSTPADAGNTPATSASAVPTDSLAATTVASASKGEELYGRCLACHQANGAGLPGAFPPLAGSEWVAGVPSRAIAILLHGVQGEITVAGTTYNSAMMPYGTGVPMSDDEVAAVLTYVRSSFGNRESAVTTAEVAKIRTATAGRTTPMTQKELAALP